MCLAFDVEDIQKRLNTKQLAKTQVVGNPIRKEIIALNDKTRNITEKDELKLLVLGGSQGAKSINNIIPDLIVEANKQGINIKVWHQTGKFSFEETKNNYNQVPSTHIKDISAYISDMTSAYDWADILICRAGALTVSESAIAGVPAIFIPLPSAVDDHQFFNAQNMVKIMLDFVLCKIK